MFTLNHFIWIFICILIIGILLFLSLKLKFSKHLAIRIMCITSILSEVLKVFTHIDPVDGDWSNGGVISATALPFHLCSIFIFVFFYLYFNKNEKVEKRLISFFVPIGLVGGLLAILMATSGVNFLKPYAYQCFIYHAVMLWLAIYFICTKQVNLGLKDFLINVATLFSLAIVMIWVNGALAIYHTNFFYVVAPPADGLPILNLNHGWYVYFAHLACCGLLLELSISLPYIISDCKKGKYALNKKHKSYVKIIGE